MEGIGAATFLLKMGVSMSKLMGYVLKTGLFQ